MILWHNGDLVIVRDDLTPADKARSPSFVDEMESCVRHVYRVRIERVYQEDDWCYIERCEQDPEAPLPDNFVWLHDWLQPWIVVDETDGEIDISNMMELL